MTILSDTNILTRLAQTGHPLYQGAIDSLNYLKHTGNEICVFPQNLVEFWVVATRPLANNGLDMTPQQAHAELTHIKRMFELLPDSPAIQSEWENLVTKYGVGGKNAHDARIVAAMTVNKVSCILTFNIADFKRFQGITVLDPKHVSQQKSGMP